MTRDHHTGNRTLSRLNRSGAALLHTFRTGILIPFFCFFSCATASAHTVEEDLLFKAAYIYNFAKFTTWPSDKWHTTTPYVNLCTIGNSPLISKLKNLHGKKIQQRTLSVITASPADIPDNCHLLYIGHSTHRQLMQMLAMTSNKPILTISDFPSFTEKGGMIELNRSAGITRLYINLSAVEQSHLKLSSRLLIMAEIRQQGAE